MNLIGGIHTIEALLTRQPERVIQLFVAQDRQQDTRIQALLAQAKAAGIRPQMVQTTKLHQWLPTLNHQGIAAECRPLPTYTEKDIEALIAQNTRPFFLILDGVQDPHNLGACLRSADAAGVTAVILPKDRSASLNATVRKVACGAAEFVPIITVTNLARALKKLQEAGVWLVGLAGEATQTLYNTDLNIPLGLVLGAEEEGLRRLTRESCDILASLPMAGSVSSLNVSVATGISLFEAVRQRR